MLGYGKPFVFFDLGETIINLRDTIGVLASLVEASYGSLAARGADLAKAWFIELSKAVPRDPDAAFENQYDVGRRILTRLLRQHGVQADESEGGRILRTAWNRWQERARLCEGVTIRWLKKVASLSAGMGAVTDGDEADVRRLLQKMELSAYFDSVTTSEAVRAYKPNPLIYRAALSSLSAKPRSSLFVSDSILDLEGAHAVGMAGALFHLGSLPKTAGLPEGSFGIDRPEVLNEALERFARSGRFEP